MEKEASPGGQALAALTLSSSLPQHCGALAHTGLVAVLAERFCPFDSCWVQCLYICGGRKMLFLLGLEGTDMRMVLGGAQMPLLTRTGFGQESV